MRPEMFLPNMPLTAEGIRDILGLLESRVALRILALQSIELQPHLVDLLLVQRRAFQQPFCVSVKLFTLQTELDLA
jgi:hypothetical protein